MNQAQLTRFVLERVTSLDPAKGKLDDSVIRSLLDVKSVSNDPETTTVLMNALRFTLQHAETAVSVHSNWVHLCLCIAGLLCQALASGSDNAIICKGFKNLQFAFAKCNKIEPVFIKTLLSL